MKLGGTGDLENVVDWEEIWMIGLEHDLSASRDDSKEAFMARRWNGDGGEDGEEALISRPRLFSSALAMVFTANILWEWMHLLVGDNIPGCGETQ